MARAGFGGGGGAGVICVTGGTATAKLAVAAFTLAWTHSVEHVAWEEDYRVVGDGLALVEARVRGSGAGMEPPEGAVLRDGAWRYRPDLPPLPALNLARSDATADWRLCTAADGCRPLRELIGPAAGTAARIAPCR